MILIVEDEYDIALSYKLILESRGHQVTLTYTGEQCIETYQRKLQLPPIDTIQSSKNLADGEELSQQHEKATQTTETDVVVGDEMNNNNSDHTFSRPEASQSVNDRTDVLPPFDVLVIDYKLPKMNGLEVAKKILELEPRQRIIFASAFVQETLMDSIIHLRHVVELLQKPFGDTEFITAIEDKEIYQKLSELNMHMGSFRMVNPTSQQLIDLLDLINKLRKVSGKNNSNSSSSIP